MWVIIAAVVVVGGIFVIYKSSSPFATSSVADSITATSTCVTTATSTDATSTPCGGPIVVDPGSSNSSNNFGTLTCGQIFPTSQIDQAFPTLKFKLVKSAASNSRHLICAYDSMTVSKGVAIIYEGLVTVYPLDPAVYQDSITGYNMLMSVRNNSSSGISGIECTAGDIGIKSSTCTGSLSVGPDKAIAEVIFASSNKNYDVVVNLSTPTAVAGASQIVEQMAKEVNSKL